MSYLEHVFHRTLFPKQLIANIHDERRDSSVFNWTVASIRNSFVFLSYLNFVEANPAGGRIVPGALRLFPRAADRVASTVERILRQQNRKGGEDALALRALSSSRVS